MTTKARGFGPALAPSVMALNPPLQPGEFSFDLGCGNLPTSDFRPLRLRRRRRRQKSGSPPLFELSLQVERNNAHTELRASRSAPGMEFNARRVLKVLKAAVEIAAHALAPIDRRAMAARPGQAHQRRSQSQAALFPQPPEGPSLLSVFSQLDPIAGEARPRLRVQLDD